MGVRRGDIVLVAGGVYANKLRPALVIQDDRFAATTSVTVVPLTSTPADAPLIRMPVRADARTGLAVDSYLMLDKLTTVRRGNVGEVIGVLGPARLVEVERLLMVLLGLAA